eukprot:12576570-Prorocentrum_lima.AAC.1
MTSSLVGSDMCIRDSLSAASDATCTVCLGEKMNTAPHLTLPGAFRPAPVSYTHLTLPTICSV